jgi:Flp pilus assembly protein CpaB
MTSGKWGLPLLAGALAFALLMAALWPSEPPQVTVVTAARDLGAGATLAASDLVVTKLPQAQTPADAVSDAAPLVGKALAVVRFAGEPVTLRHIGPAVDLGPDERGVAVRVKADTGLAGLLRPGMRIGLIATIPTESGKRETSVYAKSLLENLRVLYVPPDFQARPYTPPQTTVATQASGSSTVTSAQRTTTTATTGVREGVLLLAASTQAQEVVYQTITTTLPTAPATEAGTPAAEPPPTNWVIPVELLAALNRADAAFTLTLTPEGARGFTSAGLLLSDVVPVAVRQPETITAGQ